MLRKIRSRAGRWLRRGYRFSDLALAALGQPRLFVAAFRLVTRRKARAVESGLRLVQGRPALQAAVPAQPLARGALLQGLAARFGVLLLDDGAERLRIGLAEVDLLSALYWLGRSAHGAQLRAGRTRLVSSAADFRSAVLAAREITVDFLDPDGRPDAIVVEPYFRHDGGKWVSSNPANTEARALYDDSLAAPGQYRAQSVAIIAAAGKEDMARLDGLEHVGARTAIMGPGPGQLEQDRTHGSIDQSMDPGGQRAPRATHGAGSLVFFYHWRRAGGCGSRRHRSSGYCHRKPRIRQQEYAPNAPASRQWLKRLAQVVYGL